MKQLQIPGLKTGINSIQIDTGVVFPLAAPDFKHGFEVI